MSGEISGNSAFAVGTTGLILSNILRYCCKNTLKACRLVNSQWYDEAQRYIVLRIGSGNEDEIISTDVKKMLIDNSRALNRKLFINFRISSILNPVPQVLQNHTQKLRSLTLHNLLFFNVKDLEEVLFGTFPNMSEVLMHGVYVKRSKHRGAVSQDGLVTRSVKLPNVKKLHIHRGDCRIIADTVKHIDVDAICELGLCKLLKCFSNIEDFSYSCDIKGNEIDVFGALLAAGIGLRKFHVNLRYGSNWASSSSNYLRQFGRDLRSFSCPMVRPLTLDHFEGYYPSSLKSLSFGSVDLNYFGEGVFRNLSVLDITTLASNSFKFLERMPKLRMVRLGLAPLDGMKRKAYADDGLLQPCCTVEQLEYRMFDATDTIEDQMFEAFPNIKRLKLSGWLSSTDCEKYLAKVRLHWPKLSELQITDMVGYCRKLEAGAVDGNVPHGLLKTLTDDFRNIEHLAYTSWNVTFGDNDVKKLLSLPKLKSLKLADAKISEETKKELETRINPGNARLWKLEC